MGGIFICHATEDADAADLVVSALERAGHACWIAPRDIPAGSAYADSIIDAIGEAPLVVVLFSRHAERSQHTRRELEAATRFDVPILPVRIDGTEVEGAWVYFVGSAQWIETGTDDPQMGARVVDAVEHLLHGDPVDLPGTRRADAPRPRRRVLLGGGAAAALVAVSLLAWVLAGGDGGGGTAVSTTTATTAPPRTTVEQVGRIEVGAAVRTAPLVRANRVVVASDDGYVRAFAPDGDLEWESRTWRPQDGTGPTTVAGVVPDGTKVVTAANSGLLWSFNAANGFPTWDAPVKGAAMTGAPAVGDGAVFVGDAAGVVVRVGSETGAVEWSVDAADERVGAAPLFTAAGDLVVGTWGGDVVALDAATGSPAWPAPFRMGGRVRADPVAAGGLVLVASTAGTVAALDAGTGLPVWQVDTGLPVFRAPLVAGDTLVVAAGQPAFEDEPGTDGAVLALALTDGTRRWRADLAADAFVGTPARHGGAVYVTATDGRLRSYRLADGAPLSSVPLAGPSWAPPVVSGDELWVGSDAGVLERFALPPGE